MSRRDCNVEDDGFFMEYADMERERLCAVRDHASHSCIYGLNPAWLKSTIEAAKLSTTSLPVLFIEPHAPQLHGIQSGTQYHESSLATFPRRQSRQIDRSMSESSVSWSSRQASSSTPSRFNPLRNTVLSAGSFHSLLAAMV